MVAKIVGIVVGLVLTASFIWTIVSFRKERRLTWWAPLCALLMASVTMPVTLFAAGLKIPWVWGLALAAAGGFLGLLWGFTVKIKWQDGTPVGRNSVLWLLFFFLSYMFVYALMLFAPRTFASLGSLATAFPAGMGVGTNINLFSRLMIGGATR